MGRAITLALAASGSDVVIHYGSSSDEARGTAAEVEALGRRALIVGADLSDPEAPAAIFEAAAEIGPVQVLVNSAASFPSDTLAHVSPEVFDATMAVAVRAPVLMTSEFARRLPGDAEGCVVNVTDWRTQRPYPDHFSYTVAKGAIDTFTVAAAESLAPRIRVNAIALGAMLPPPGRDSTYLRELAQEIPLERVGGTDPAAGAVVFLVGNHFVTGEILRINGGAHLR